tara:strand:+ start:304 stop:624 length:321 start_codon:yes stop_codon:yes gene_type:complete
MNNNKMIYHSGYFRDTGIGYQKTDTSKRAAQSSPKHKLTIRDRVFELLQKAGVALTTEEIADFLNCPYASVQPRLSELQNSGKVIDSGYRGKTKWGKSCIKWKVKN